MALRAALFLLLASILVSTGQAMAGSAPIDFKDRKTGVVFRLEPDEHHLLALGPDGSTVWEVDSDPKLLKRDPVSVKPLALFFKEGRSIQYVNNFKGFWELQYSGILDTSNGVGIATAGDFLFVRLGSKDGANQDEDGIINKSTGKYTPLSVRIIPGELSHGFQDVNTKIVFILNHDGRHLSAARPNGTILWAINTDRKLANGGKIAVIYFYPIKKQKNPSSREGNQLLSEVFLTVQFVSDGKLISGGINELTGGIVFVSD